jgi:hypothetical protein
MKRLLSLLMLLPGSAPAQDTLFTADLQMMSRGEIRNGGMKADSNNPSSEDKSAFILDRERLILGYKRGWLETKLSVQHVGTWGREGTAGVSIFEGWGKMTARNGLFAQIGRLALQYDDERIIGADDWVMVPMTHDALRLGYEGHGHQLHTILAYNQNLRALSEPGSYYKDGSRPYKTMQTVWYHYDVPKVPLGVSLLFMNIGMQAGVEGKSGEVGVAPHTEWQQLYGGYLKYAPPHLTLEGSYYRQTGHDEKMVKLDTWMAAVKATYDLSTVNSPLSFQAGYDYLSGDDYVVVLDPGSMGLPYHGVNKGFDPVYGSHHKFYGAMDFFYISTYVNGFTPGLQNAYIGFTYKPLNEVSLSATYHYLATGIELEGLNKTLGHEVELEAIYDITKDIKLSAGFSYMTGTETMERLKRASDDGSLRWAWLSLKLSPRLFSVKY